MAGAPADGRHPGGRYTRIFVVYYNINIMYFVIIHIIHDIRILFNKYIVLPMIGDRSYCIISMGRGEEYCIESQKYWDTKMQT
jgi:hypothetical protein